MWSWNHTIRWTDSRDVYQHLPSRVLFESIRCMVYDKRHPKHHPWRHPNWKIQVGVGFIHGCFTTTGVKFEDSKVASRNEVTRVFVWLLMQEILLPPRIMGSQVTGWDWNNGNGSFAFFCPCTRFFLKKICVRMPICAEWDWNICLHLP